VYTAVQVTLTCCVFSSRRARHGRFRRLTAVRARTVFESLLAEITLRQNASRLCTRPAGPLLGPISKSSVQIACLELSQAGSRQPGREIPVLIGPSPVLPSSCGRRPRRPRQPACWLPACRCGVAPPGHPRSPTAAPGLCDDGAASVGHRTGRAETAVRILRHSVQRADHHGRGSSSHWLSLLGW
jgi:hypothetical protein